MTPCPAFLETPVTTYPCHVPGRHHNHAHWIGGSWEHRNGHPKIVWHDRSIGARRFNEAVELFPTVTANRG